MAVPSLTSAGNGETSPLVTRRQQAASCSAAAAASKDKCTKKQPYYGTTESSDTFATISDAHSESSSVTGSDDNQESSSPSTTRPNNNNNKKQPKSSELLQTLQFATIIFYSVSGGPFGIEESVRAAGPFWTLVGFLVVAPLVFSIPECLVTCELTACIPANAAGCAWVEQAFGPSAGFITGYWNWLSGATDNAIYPVLFLEYALQVFPIESLQHNNEDNNNNDMLRYVLVTTISIALAYLNWLGLDLVGNMSIAVCCVAMSPFVVFCVLGSTQVDPQRWFQLPTDYYYYDYGTTTTTTVSSMSAMMMVNATTTTMSLDTTNDDDEIMEMEGGFLPNVVLGGVLLRPLVNNLFWNYNSFDNAGSFAEDISNPVRVLPRAMFWAFVMTVLGYVLPLLVALGTTDASPDQWVDGYLATVITETVGPWLGTWLVVAAAISNLGQFQAEMSSDAYMLSGMASRGYLPKFLAHRSPTTGSPTYALLVGTLVIVVMGVSNLDDLIEMLNFNYALALFMQYAAFLKLRICQPDIVRPFRVPLGTTGCIVGLIPTFAALGLVVALASYTTIFVNLAMTAFGIVIYQIMMMTHQRGNADDAAEEYELLSNTKTSSNGGGENHNDDDDELLP